MNRDDAYLLDILNAIKQIQYDRININTLWDVVHRDIIKLGALITPLLPNAEP